MWNVKLYDVFEGHAFFFRINRNIVECKEGINADYIDSGALVLIETLWNVKRKLWEEFGYVWKVLIETLWNVKSVHQMFRQKPLPVLIETLWNVKRYRNDFINLFPVVLIETLWNVKRFEGGCHED